MSTALKGEILAEGAGNGLALKSVNGNSNPADGDGPNGWASNSNLAREGESNPVYSYLLNLGVRSRKTQRSALKLFLWALRGEDTRLQLASKADRDELESLIYEFPWNKLTAEEIDRGIVVMRDVMKYAGNSVQRTKAAVNQVMAKCTKATFRGTRWEMKSADYADATDAADRPKIKLNRGGVTGRALEADELAALFAACEVRIEWDETAGGSKPKGLEEWDGKDLPKHEGPIHYKTGAMVRKPERPATTARDKAILALLFLKAMRVQEVVNLTLAHLHRRTGKVDIQGGKTGSRSFHLTGPAKIFLDQWLDHRFEADRRRTAGPIFYRVDKVGTVHPTISRYQSHCSALVGPDGQAIREDGFVIRNQDHAAAVALTDAGQAINICGYDIATDQKATYKSSGRSSPITKCPACTSERLADAQVSHLSTQTVRKMLIRRCEIAGIERATTHDGRRTTISWYLDNDSLPAAQDLAGHASPEQTLMYRRYSKKQHSEATDAVDRAQAEALGMEIEPEPEPEAEV